RPDGDLSGMTSEDIELAIDWTGEPGAFFGALVETGLIEDGVLGSGLWSPGKRQPIGRICSKAWRKVRLFIFARDGWACVYCGAKNAPLECDHVVPLSRGGTNERRNLATACRPCNRSKRAKLLS